MKNCYQILLVDDDKTFSYVLKKEIGRMGHEITLAGDGNEALEKLREGNYDLVLLDQRLPGQDGKAVLTEMKKLDPMIEVIILTGYGTIENAVEAMKVASFSSKIVFGVSTATASARPLNNFTVTLPVTLRFK